MAGRRGGEATNCVARLSEWADAHLTLVRNISTGLAIAGVILLAKSVKLTTKFTNALEIPPEFIKKNVKLRGRLHQITEQGLQIEHVPITLPFISSFQKRCNGCFLTATTATSQKGRFSSVCLNEEILRNGLGRTVPIDGLSHESRMFWKLHRRLLQAELKAVKKSKGIWKEETFIEKFKERMSNNKYMQKLKQVASWLKKRL